MSKEGCNKVFCFEDSFLEEGKCNLMNYWWFLYKLWYR